MIRENYEIDEEILKTSQDVTLWKTEKGLLEIDKDTLVIKIRQDGEVVGYVFHGQGRLLIDAIVETEEGAIGRPIDKELSSLFLMIGELEETQKNFTETSGEDLSRKGYQNQQAVESEAEDLCNKFLRGRSKDRRGFRWKRGHIFAIRNEEGEIDILMVKGSNLVYKANDVTFVSKDKKSVLRTPNEVVCSSNGKSVIIYKDKSIIIGQSKFPSLAPYHKHLDMQ